MTLKLHDNYIKFNSDTLENVRKEFNLNKPGAMDQALDILEEWVQKQQHFVKKDFPREYLERFIISSKGSVEKAKLKIDKLCTARTLIPHLFEKCHAKEDFPNIRDFFISLPMPKLNKDDCRIYIEKIMTKNVKHITHAACLEAIQHCVILCEYMMLRDYTKGNYVIYDLCDTDLIAALGAMDLVNFRNAVITLTQGYGVKLEKVFIITPSKMINALLNIVNQIVSSKISQKIFVLKTKEALHQYIAKEYLPVDLGGEQKSIVDLYDELNEELSSMKHVAYMKEMRQACTNEALRSTDTFNKEYLGMPGSFKVLSVD